MIAPDGRERNWGTPRKGCSIHTLAQQNTGLKEHVYTLNCQLPLNRFHGLAHHSCSMALCRQCRDGESENGEKQRFSEPQWVSAVRLTIVSIQIYVKQSTLPLLIRRGLLEGAMNHSPTPEYVDSNTLPALHVQEWYPNSDSSLALP